MSYNDKICITSSWSDDIYTSAQVIELINMTRQFLF